MFKVLGFGDNIIDHFVDRNVAYPGGNCINFAVFAKQLGLDAGYMGTFGSDNYGEFLRSELASIGLDLSRCIVRGGETGIALVEVVGGERVFRGGNKGGVTVREPIILNADDMAYARGFDLVHSSVYSASETQLPAVAQLDVLVSYDLSSEDAFRSSSYLGQVAPCLDLALISCSRLDDAATEDLVHDVVAKGAGMAIATRGEAGSLLFDGMNLFRADAVPLDPSRVVADTMGCGDAMLAAVVVGLLGAGWRKGAHPHPDAVAAALKAGSAYAAEQCFVEGAFGHGRALV